MADRATICAIEIGNAKTCAAIAVHEPRGGYTVIDGWGQSETEGLQQGSVTDMRAVEASLSEALATAEQMSGTTVRSALVSLSGSHLTTLSSRARIPASRNEPVGEALMEQVLRKARQIKVRPDQQIVQALPGSWTIDDEYQVREPEGMHAGQLGVEARLVTGSSAAISNQLACLAALDVQVENLVPSALASARAVLTREEMDMGVVLVDIGAGTTDFAVYARGRFQVAGTLNLGGNDLTRELAHSLHCPSRVAEQLKITHGSAMELSSSLAGEVTAEVFGDQRHISVSTRHLCQVLHQRVGQLWDRLDRHLVKAECRRLIPAGLVLTGGGSLLPRIADSCRARFRLPVRTGTVPPSIPVRDLAAEVRSPEFATISGLLLWGLEAHRPAQPAEGQARPEPARGWIRSLRTVVAGFLPG